jgi:hypothetical protein
VTYIMGDFRDFSDSVYKEERKFKIIKEFVLVICHHPISTCVSCQRNS